MGQPIPVRSFKKALCMWLPAPLEECRQDDRFTKGGTIRLMIQAVIHGEPSRGGLSEFDKVAPGACLLWASEAPWHSLSTSKVKLKPRPLVAAW